MHLKLQPRRHSRISGGDNMKTQKLGWGENTWAVWCMMHEVVCNTPYNWACEKNPVVCNETLNLGALCRLLNFLFDMSCFLPWKFTLFFHCFCCSCDCSILALGHDPGTLQKVTAKPWNQLLSGTVFCALTLPCGGWYLLWHIFSHEPTKEDHLQNLSTSFSRSR